jgi:hypothetical protein
MSASASGSRQVITVLVHTVTLTDVALTKLVAHDFVFG